jgi:hypothetical protein
MSNKIPSEPLRRGKFKLPEVLVPGRGNLRTIQQGNQKCQQIPNLEEPGLNDQGENFRTGCGHATLENQSGDLEARK